MLLPSRAAVDDGLRGAESLRASWDEMFDEVSVHDEVVGEVSASQAHRAGKLHRATLVVACVGEHVLLNQRSFEKFVYPGK